MVTNGTAADKANNFVATSALVDSLNEGINNYVISPISAASGGSLRESVDEIKFGAPAQFTTQNRLVTFKDYESYIKKNYPSVDSLSVWGGEDAIPPVYGKVFVSLKPKQNYYISETEKQRIVDDIISPKAIVSVGAEIIDPQYLYLLIDNYVEYDKNKTTLGLFGDTSRCDGSIPRIRHDIKRPLGHVLPLRSKRTQSGMWPFLHGMESRP